MLAQVALRKQTVPPVFPVVLELRQHDDLPCAAVDDADDLLHRIPVQLADYRRKEAPRRGDEEKPRRPEVLPYFRLEQVAGRGLDLDGHDILEQDLRPVFDHMLVEQDDVMLEAAPLVVRKNSVRLLDLVAASTYVMSSGFLLG